MYGHEGQKLMCTAILSHRLARHEGIHISETLQVLSPWKTLPSSSGKVMFVQVVALQKPESLKATEAIRATRCPKLQSSSESSRRIVGKVSFPIIVG